MIKSLAAAAAAATTGYIALLGTIFGADAAVEDCSRPKLLWRPSRSYPPLYSSAPGIQKLGSTIHCYYCSDRTIVVGGVVLDAVVVVVVATWVDRFLHFDELV